MENHGRVLDGCLNGWRYSKEHTRVGGWLGGQDRDAWVTGWTEGQMGEFMNKWMDRWMDG